MFSMMFDNVSYIISLWIHSKLNELFVNKEYDFMSMVTNVKGKLTSKRIRVNVISYHSMDIQ